MHFHYENYLDSWYREIRNVLACICTSPHPLMILEYTENKSSVQITLKMHITLFSFTSYIVIFEKHISIKNTT